MNKNFLIALHEICGLHVQEDQSLTSTPGKLMKSSNEAQTWLNGLLKDPTATGWAQFSDANVLIEGGALHDAPRGVLLSAELHLGGADKDESHHLRFDGSEWITAIITQAQNAGSILETRTFISSGKGRLHYQVAWKPDATSGALRPDVFRLINPQALKP
jgi:hypothetical protein